MEMDKLLHSNHFLTVESTDSEDFIIVDNSSTSLSRSSSISSFSPVITVETNVIRNPIKKVASKTIKKVESTIDCSKDMKPLYFNDSTYGKDSINDNTQMTPISTATTTTKSVTNTSAVISTATALMKESKFENAAKSANVSPIITPTITITEVSPLRMRSRDRKNNSVSTILPLNNTISTNNGSKTSDNIDDDGWKLVLLVMSVMVICYWISNIHIGIDNSAVVSSAYLETGNTDDTNSNAMEVISDEWDTYDDDRYDDSLPMPPPNDVNDIEMREEKELSDNFMHLGNNDDIDDSDIDELPSATEISLILWLLSFGCCSSISALVWLRSQCQYRKSLLRSQVHTL